MQRIYLDHAASTIVEKSVLELIIAHTANNFANPSALHTEGRKAKAAIETARKQIATCLNCNSNELFFCSSATEANNTVIKSAVYSLGVQTIISSRLEHPCVENSILWVKKTFPNTQIAYVDSTESGQIDLSHLEKLLAADDSKKLFSIIHAHNELGFINPIAEIGNLCERFGAYFHTDAVQTASRLELGLEKGRIHFAVASGHKIGAGKGAAALFISRKIGLKSFIHGGSQERGFRAGTENTTAIAAFGKAWELAHTEKNIRQEQLLSLKNIFIQEISQLIPNIQFNYSDQNNSLSHIVSLRLPTDLALSTLLFKLDLAGLSVSAGAACSAGAVVASSVSRFLNLPAGYQTIRVSFSHHNTTEEVLKAAAIIAKIK